MTREHALAIAKDLRRLLKPVTSRLVIAGSLRRRKQTVNDIEILFTPKLEQRQFDLLTISSFDLASELLNGLRSSGEIAKRPSANGRFVWGQQNKLARLPDGTPVDFFSTTEDKWWVALVVRTGSLAMNLELTTGAQRLGRSLNAYGTGVTCSDNSVIPATSEQHVFELCGVPYREPWERG